MKKDITLEDALALLQQYNCVMYPLHETEESQWHVVEQCWFNEEGDVVSTGSIIASGKTWQEAFEKAYEDHLKRFMEN